MERTVEFPKLGLEFTMSNGFTIGNMFIAWYGVLIALGLLLAVVYAYKHFRRFGVDEDHAFNVIICGIIGGVIGARLYYVAFSWENYGFDFSSFQAFWDSLYHIIATWEGGMAIYGGLIGALICGLIASRFWKLNIRGLLDLTGIGFLIGQGIGRWGNFVNVEAFGSNTELPWGMTGDIVVNYLSAHQAEFAASGIVVDPNVPVHPCFLYESLWCLAGFLLLHFYGKHRRFDGELFILYIGWNGLGRLWIEGLRTDSLMLGSIRVSQLLALLMFLGALAVWIGIHLKIRSMHDPEYRKLYALTDEWKSFVAEKANKEKAVQSEKEKKLARIRAAKEEKQENEEDDNGEED